MKTKRIIFFLALPLICFGLYALICIGYAKLTYFQPAEKIVLSTKPENAPLTDSVFSAIIWNIGYAGLGAETDFFYDGGKMMCPPQSWTEKYLMGIDGVLRSSNCDFYLLQEVDRDSKRSYSIDQVEEILKDKALIKNFAVNYKVNYIPMPWTEPMGKVLGGLMTMSEYTPNQSIRFQLPGEFGFPKQLFFLRRCLLVNRYALQNGHELVIINVHNSAYDETGKLKRAEMEYLKKMLELEYSQGNYIVVGGDWNQCPPGFAYDALSKGKEGDYVQTNVDSNYMPGWQWVADRDFATNRKNNKAYNPKTTFTTLIDFYLLSPNISVQNIRGIPTEFAYSDHQPVKLDFKLIQ
ncbi:MAG: hypothetical protein KA797_03995 [Chitinophagales bacterium]|nr:hypothetical protein [Chitinophagales bacterium]